MCVQINIPVNNIRQTEKSKIKKIIYEKSGHKVHVQLKLPVHLWLYFIEWICKKIAYQCFNKMVHNLLLTLLLELQSH